VKKLKPGFASLRAHDLHQGLQVGGVDRGHGVLGEEFIPTQTIGMAAALATTIKGIERIEDANHLRRVAIQQCDIDGFALDGVVRLLEDTGFVRNVRRDASGRVTGLWETVPEDFGRVYETLDEAYEGKKPGELELAVVGVIDDLSYGPLHVESLDTDPELLGRILEVGDHAEAIKIASKESGIVYSPFFSYEHPDEVATTLQEMDIDDVRAAFTAIRSYQGLPIGEDKAGKVVNGLVAAGLLAGPGLLSPGHTVQSFAIAPYGLAPELLTIKKTVLDKAMAVVAAVRMGQHFGGMTTLRDPVVILARLLAGNWVARHSSTPRQYGVLRDLGIVRFTRGAFGLTQMQLIDTRDNRLAVTTAIDLLKFGESIVTKSSHVADTDMPDRFRAPIQTVSEARKRQQLPKAVVGDLWETAMGHKPLV